MLMKQEFASSSKALLVYGEDYVNYFHGCETTMSFVLVSEGLQETL